MIRKIFRSTLLATTGVFLASLVLIIGVHYRHFTQTQMDQLKQEASLVAHGVGMEGKGYFEELDLERLRITWVDNQGQVLHDTDKDSSTMDNHLDREEIREALSSGYGESTRFSSTLTQTSLYVAQRLDNGTVVRLSVTRQSIIQVLLNMVPSVILVILIAIVLSTLMARYTAKSIVEPLNALNLEKPLENNAYEELSPLLRRISLHQREVVEQEELITRRQKEFDTIISKIKEGMLILSDQRSIVSINPAAMSLLGAGEACLGRDILEVTRDFQLNQLIDEGLKGQKGEGFVNFNGADYRVLIRPIVADARVTGVVVLLFDVTEQLQAEQMRREFTANVSHELKTPLHLIAGYSEMLTNRFVSEDDVHHFSEKIYIESQRMIQLVEDIIHLSQLDETSQVAMASVDLYQVAKNVLDALSSRATSKRVSLHLSGESAVLEGNPALVHSLLYNLCDNAIKYNQEHGHVYVSVKPRADGIQLEVKDTGIGIAKDDQERIFERFYRVDKSRSKKVGGTGLGLSIVKHALKIHRANIAVDSQLGQGTRMTVTFKG